MFFGQGLSSRQGCLFYRLRSLGFQIIVGGFDFTDLALGLGFLEFESSCYCYGIDDTPPTNHT
jgi:hypothetical protein